ncbi:MAG: DUF1499 domain-containing protein [Mangrovicoccus sp.]
MRMSVGLSLIIVAVVAVFGLYVRLAPSDPAKWHINPLTKGQAGQPGGVLVSKQGGDFAAYEYALSPTTLLSMFDEVALAAPRTKILAGSLREGHITYITRSPFWGFPDYISVLAVPTRDGATLAIYSRLRFGQSDLGVNRKRLKAWLAQLDDKAAAHRLS